MIIDKYIYVVAFNSTAAVRCGKDMSIDDNLCSIRDNCGVNCNGIPLHQRCSRGSHACPLVITAGTAAVMSDLIGA